jgi:mercuric ion transport protein
MKDVTMLKTGIAGSVIAAICCFTPALVLVLGAVGLSAWLGWIDYVLLPALAMFLAITGYGVYLRRRKRVLACCGTGQDSPTQMSGELHERR